MFALFADLIAFHLDAEERLSNSQKALAAERRMADLREQFVAVLGHDLRNPLAAIDAGTHLLRMAALGPAHERTLDLMQQSAERMTGLIDAVLDLACARLGGGLTVVRRPDAPLEPALMQVIEELRASSPGRVIQSDLSLAEPVDCDPERMAQMLSNLLANALVHGAPDQPVSVSASSDGRAFELSVSNSGDPIASETMGRLFQPFFRGNSRAGHKGLGLGLYIASEIAREHGGTLEVSSAAAQTRFTFRMTMDR